MARASTPTLLSIDQWAQVLGFSPWLINQIGEGGGLVFGQQAQCDTVFYQYSYQRQFLSREEIGQAIAKAEAAIFPLMRFYPAPVYSIAEEHPYPHDARRETPDWLTPQGKWKSIGLNGKLFCEIGTRTRTLIGANQAYVTSDSDGDGVDDTFTLTIATTETNVDYIGVYYNAATRDDLDETWRIRPVQVLISGGNAVITGHLAQLVNPNLQRLPNPVPLQVDTSNVYVASLDVYQVKPDTTAIGTAHWNSRAGWINDASSSAIGNYEIASKQQSYIRPVIGGACYGLNRAPDRVEINYLSGYPLSNGKIQAPYAQMIAFLSCAYLPGLSCGCDRADQILFFWRNSPSDGEQGTFPVTIEQVNSMNFPPVRGGFYAAQQIELVLETMGLAI